MKERESLIEHVKILQAHLNTQQTHHTFSFKDQLHNKALIE